MPRLIDADLLVTEIKKRIRTPRSTMEILRDIIPVIDNQPTAYDVDVVVEQLKKFKVGCPESYRGGEGCVAGRPCHECKMAAVIEIVKAGGITGKVSRCR